MIKTATSTLIACAATAVLGSFAMVFAADAPMPDKPAITKEMREKMAIAHEHVAACLRSNRSVEECHQEMMKAHEKMAGAGGDKHEHDCDKMMKMHETMEHEEHEEHAKSGESEHDATK